MTEPSYERRSFSETAVETTLSGSINDSDLTIGLASSTGWPTGAAGDFYIRVESEDIRVDTRSSLTLTVLSTGRGANGTTAASHASGVAVSLIFTALDADEANYAVSKTVGKVTAAGDLLVGDAANSLAKLAIGSTGLPLVAGASTPAYTQLGTSGIADDAITSAKIAADQITSTEIAADAVGTSEIAADAVTSSEIATDAVGTAEIAALAVGTAELAAASVTSAKLDSGVVDDSTIQFNSGVLRVKDGGVTAAKAASGLHFHNVATSAPTGVAGETWYDSDDNLLYVYNGTDWVCVTPVSAVVATSQTTTSTGFTNLATTGPAVTVNTGTKALVTVSAVTSNSSTALTYMGYAVSGATTVAAGTSTALQISSPSPGGVIYGASRQAYITGLTPGANVFTAKYAVQANTGTWADRNITVIGIP